MPELALFVDIDDEVLTCLMLVDIMAMYRVEFGDCRVDVSITMSKLEGLALSPCVAFLMALECPNFFYG